MITDFIFDGMALSDFGYVLFFDDSSDSTTVSNMSFESIKAARSDAHQRVSYTYESNYECSFIIMKNPCVYECEEQFLTNDDVSEMVRWLSCKEYKWFRLIDDKDNDEIWYRVQIQIDKEYAGDNAYGLKLKVLTDSPYGYTKEQKRSDTLLNGDSLEVMVISDEHTKIYPDVTITMRANGKLYLSNINSGVGTTLENCVQGEVITIKGGNTCQISSTNDHNWETDFNYRFPYFDVKGTQSVEFRNNGVECKVEMIYRGIRKVGLG